MDLRPTVREIGVTPVKSTQLHHPTSVRLERQGAVDDRRFFLVDAHSRRLEATSAALSLVSADWDPVTRTLELAFPEGVRAAGVVELGDYVEALVPDTGQAVGGRRVVGPWCTALSAYLGQATTLVEAPAVTPAHDVEPMTVVSDASIAHLQAQMGVAELGARRFRMTLTLTAQTPFSEDRWYGRLAAVGSAVLKFGGAVPRCVVTSRDPSTGLRDYPVLSALRTLRPPTFDPQSGEVKMPFGVYATVEQPGVAAVGDFVVLDP